MVIAGAFAFLVASLLAHACDVSFRGSALLGALTAGAACCLYGIVAG